MATVALPQYQKAVEKSRIMALVPNLRTLKDSLEMYYLANGVYPNDSVTDLDIHIQGCKSDYSRENAGKIRCSSKVSGVCESLNGFLKE